ncbi:MAG: hypothetical protein D6695_02800, partial [Planctomycetota bacterium]
MLVVLALIAAVAALLGLSRWHGSPAPGPLMGKAAGSLDSQVSQPAQIIVRAWVYVVDAAGVASVEGARVVEVVGRSGGTVDPPSGKVLSADLAALAARGQARVLSSPGMLVLSGKPASVSVGQLATAGPTLALELKVSCQSGAGGSIDGRYSVHASVVSGGIEQRLAELGLPVGDQAAVRVETVS